MRVCAAIGTAAVGTGTRPAVDGACDRSRGTPTSTTTSSDAATTATATTVEGDRLIRPPDRRGATGLIQPPRACKWPARKSVCGTDEACGRRAPADGPGRTARHTDQWRHLRADRRADRSV